jgi:pimeloyl-ACP methyl ester carboxylesterase
MLHAHEFTETSVAVDGTRLRVLEAGQGEPLVVLPGPDGMHLSRAHELLTRWCRVIGLDLSGIGLCSARELATTASQAIQQLGLERVTLLGTSLGAAVALEIAGQQPERTRALILESPRGLLDADERDAVLEEQLRRLSLPTLVLCGTRDRVNPPGMGRRYRELIPRCHFILTYDAGHCIGLDRPDAFAEVVGDYTQRLEAFVVQRESGVIHP